MKLGPLSSFWPSSLDSTHEARRIRSESANHDHMDVMRFPRDYSIGPKQPIPEPFQKPVMPYVKPVRQVTGAASKSTQAFLNHVQR